MLVLVTGGSGFVGAHCLQQLLSQGHQVRTTVRSPQRADAVRAMLEPGAVATVRSTVESAWKLSIEREAHLFARRAEQLLAELDAATPGP